MAPIRAEQTGVVAATAEQVYAVLADYRAEHPQVLPKPYFSELVVEQGGFGAGTVFRVAVTVFGQTTPYHMRVAEPEPGRVLSEVDIATGLATSFTLTPLPDGRTEVRIATVWEPRPGLYGLLERLTAPGVMRRIYRRELALLDEHLRRRLKAED
jgi:hypothetical protein